MSNIHESILECIGETPVVRLKSIAKDSPHQFFAKIEYFNPGGSVKDRIAQAIIEGAEKRGELKPGGTIVEATSGNTGLGLALVAAVKGYKCIFVMPDKISEEKRQMLKAYGAKVVITPTNVEPEDPTSYLSVAKAFVEKTPNSFYANQYHNPDNVNLHFNKTGPEIWKQMNGEIDIFVGGAGTGGTISGVGRYLKTKKPTIKVLCADPHGSILHDLFYHKKIVTPPHSYKVEGVGEDMLPENVHLDVIDDFEQVSDQEAFDLTRKLIKEEALCVGPSSALALSAALKYGKKVKTPSKFLVVFPDSGRAYLSKVFNDQWMFENDFLAKDVADKAFNKVIMADQALKELNGK